MAPATATSFDETAVRKQAQPVLDRFYDAVIACGYSPPFKPEIDVSRSPEPVHYDHARRAVVLTSYDLLEPARREAMERFAKAGTLGLSGRDQYVEVFNNLLVAHELGHWIQESIGRSLTRWEAEFEANRMMVAFWRDHPAVDPAPSTEDRLNNFVAQPPQMLAITRDLRPSPEVYFNEHVAEIEAQPVQYAAFQKLMVRLAISESPRPTFSQTIEAARRLP